MLEAFIVFVATLCSVGLGCLQAINVVGGYRLRTMVTSIAQSIAALTLYRVAPHVETTAAIIAFLVGGVCGGQFALYVSRVRRT